MVHAAIVFIPVYILTCILHTCSGSYLENVWRCRGGIVHGWLVNLHQIAECDIVQQFWHNGLLQEINSKT